MLKPLLLEIPTAFETERLLLRRYQAGDGAAFYAMMQRNKDHLADELDPEELEVTEETAEIHVRQLAVDWLARKQFRLSLWEKATQMFVGEIHIGVVSWDVPELEIGYFVIKEREGQGIITEAVKATLQFIFTHFQAHKVSIRCNDTNPKSARVAERCGFVKEGLRREMERTKDGGFKGLLYYGLLRREYEERYGQLGN